jgi:hypothetical protein
MFYWFVVHGIWFAAKNTIMGLGVIVFQKALT